MSPEFKKASHIDSVTDEIFCFSNKIRKHFFLSIYNHISAVIGKNLVN